MDQVVIGSNASKLVLARSERSNAGAATALRAGLRTPGLSCDQDVYEFDEYAGLTAFFGGMSDAWRGWTGDRVFTSLEGDLQITATHRGSHVILRVELHHGTEPDWWVTAMIDIDAGEDLSGAARDLRELVGHG